MEIINWIGKNITEVKEGILYKRYFENIPIEKGIDVYMLFNSAKGIDIILEHNYFIKSVHFYGVTNADVNKFSDKLPFDLAFSYSRIRTTQILGPPDKSGGGDFSFIYGVTPTWDKYIFKNFSLHLQFSEDHCAIELITLGTK